MFLNLVHSLNVVVFETSVITPDRLQSKTPYQLTNADPKSLETVFSIAIYRKSGEKWQSKTPFLTIFLSTFVDSFNVFD